MNLIRDISIFHTLGFPILLGTFYEKDLLRIYLEKMIPKKD